MKKVFVSLLLLTTQTLLAQQQQSVDDYSNSHCMSDTQEINAEPKLPLHMKENQGTKSTNEIELKELSDLHRLFYHVNEMTICPTSDGEAIRGIQFGIGPYVRGDAETMSKKVDPSTLMQLRLNTLGIYKGNCFQFKLEPEDYITEITVKHSKNTINSLQFKTDLGQVKTVGSQQSDATNMFNWKVTKVTFQEHERLLGGFGHAKRIMGQVQLTTIGFFKSDCWFGPKPKSTKTQETTTTTDDESIKPSLPVTNNLNQLPGRDQFGRSESKSFHSHTGSPGEQELVRKESAIGLILIVALSCVGCCICAYFIAKNRGKCFRKLSHEEREEQRTGRMRVGQDSGLEISELDGPDMSDRRA